MNGPPPFFWSPPALKNAQLSTAIPHAFLIKKGFFPCRGFDTLAVLWAGDRCSYFYVAFFRRGLHATQMCWTNGRFCQFSWWKFEISKSLLRNGNLSKGEFLKLCLIQKGAFSFEAVTWALKWGKRRRRRRNKDDYFISNSCNKSPWATVHCAQSLCSQARQKTVARARFPTFFVSIGKKPFFVCFSC